ncbi:SSI family serine proteinase inhibitor [Streptomyces zhihengii]|uniref:Protease inhibitor SIL-V5 n=1 Tax=Streptomyces zhihengii TaxID=1818004 RepID=A0ABS2UZF3_9ACTN|nr:SSI family serine proteinase inhibitor [Streptomyces zhihengii]MBM9622941.1 protease inhibitor SIL-V5 [Streptomyces zhihengii]
MHRTAALAAVALLAVAAAVPAAAASPAPDTVAAAPAAEKPAPPRGLFLTVSGAENSWIRGVLLHCSPEPSGPHPDAAGACAALDEARGDLDLLSGDPHPCTKQYDPVTVSATGAWRGRPTAWHKTFANACELSTATGALFRF